MLSYTTPVAARSETLLVRTSTQWSQTTNRHIKKWLGGDFAQSIQVPQRRVDDIYYRTLHYSMTRL